ncbi:MAG TPA: HipA N-terminal domain-containing protein [Rhodanobacter sp.]
MVNRASPYPCTRYLAYVGRWERTRSGTDQLIYDRQWMEAPEGRPLSLSLPFTTPGTHGKTAPLPAAAVAAYFDNLLPDNDRILRRLRDRYGASSTSAFDLLATIGRDCVGAVQLVPAEQHPDDVHAIDAEPLTHGEVAQVLRDTTLAAPLGRLDREAFRLSIASAQEKTALLRHQDQWSIPRRSTPSTHIFKLPLGIVGNMQADIESVLLDRHPGVHSGAEEVQEAGRRTVHQRGRSLHQGQAAEPAE